MLNKLKSTFVRELFRFVRRRSGTAFGFKIQRLAESLHRASYNAGYDFETNGEMRALNVATQRPGELVLFDVGAHTGGWSKAALSRAPGARIFAFEPAAGTYAKLAANIGNIPQISAFPFGLSDQTLTRELLVSPGTAQKTSIEVASAARLNVNVADYQHQSAQFMRGEEFCARHGIDHIDFLKVDTEGHDIKVLHGLADMLLEQRIDVIQFEYNRLNIFARALLYDFYELLENGYAIGRIYPNNVAFKPYQPHDETFIDGNFICVRRNMPELISRLAG
jgi:FkbM family methyltransferase